MIFSGVVSSGPWKDGAYTHEYDATSGSERGPGRTLAGSVHGDGVRRRPGRPVGHDLGRLGRGPLDRFEAVAPAQLVKDSGGSAVRFPVRSATGDPSLTNLPEAQGDGVLDGGVAVRAQSGTFQLVDLESVLQDGAASGKCVVNGFDVGHHSVVRCGLAEGLLTADSVPLGQPTKVQLSAVPLRATPELLEAYTATFGTPAFTADTVLAYVTAEGVYTPPKP
jgi:hypothetical protein